MGIHAIGVAKTTMQIASVYAGLEMERSLFGDVGISSALDPQLGIALAGQGIIEEQMVRVLHIELFLTVLILPCCTSQSPHTLP